MKHPRQETGKRTQVKHMKPGQIKGTWERSEDEEQVKQTASVQQQNTELAVWSSEPFF